jgi:enamine deaminase RidA (YjgF/YER057c/UK114 family)
MKRTNISSESPWEPIVGYSRAVRIGNAIAVSGTTASDENGRVSGDAYTQTIIALEKIERSLKEAGATLEDVIRTRMYVTDITLWEEIGRAHKKFFGSIRPATTMVEVKSLISKEMIVEIEADAVIDGR